MPELPEVQTVVNTLTPRVSGRAFVRVVHVRGDMVTPTGFNLAAALTARRIVSVARSGKRIVFLIKGNDDDRYDHFFIHLGMSGRLTVERAAAPVEPHTHLRVDLGDGLE